MAVISPPGAWAAMSAVSDPGPQPTSRIRSPARRWGSRYRAEFATVREEWERNTDSWWPWT